MPEPYSLDLRTRVAHAVGDVKDIAKRYEVSTVFVYRMKKLLDLTGNLASKPKGGKRPRAVDATGEQWLIELIAKENDLFLLELCARYEEQFGIKVSKSAMDRTLHHLKITRKKKQHTIQKCKVNELKS